MANYLVDSNNLAAVEGATKAEHQQLASVVSNILDGSSQLKLTEATATVARQPRGAADTGEWQYKITNTFAVPSNAVVIEASYRSAISSLQPWHQDNVELFVSRNNGTIQVQVKGIEDFISSTTAVIKLTYGVYSEGLTISELSGLPDITPEDEGKYLRVVEGSAAWDESDGRTGHVFHFSVEDNLAISSEDSAYLNWLFSQEPEDIVDIPLTAKVMVRKTTSGGLDSYLWITVPLTAWCEKGSNDYRGWNIEGRVCPITNTGGLGWSFNWWVEIDIDQTRYPGLVSDLVNYSSVFPIDNNATAVLTRAKASHMPTITGFFFPTIGFGRFMSGRLAQGVYTFTVYPIDNATGKYRTDYYYTFTANWNTTDNKLTFTRNQINY